MRVLTCLGVTWAIGWWQFKPLYGYVSGIIDGAVKEALKGTTNQYNQATISVTEPFMFRLKFSFLIGLIIAIPYIVIQLWGFIAPALRESEQRPFKRLAPLSAILFLCGAGFAWAIVPASMAWFADQATEFQNLVINQEIGVMVILVVKMLLAFGVAFQLPLVVYGLGMAGLLSAESLLKYWRHAATVIFAFAAIITPSNDPLSMSVMAVPLTLLFIASVYAIKFMQRKQERPEHQDNATPYLIDMGEPIAKPDEEDNNLNGGA